MLVSSSERTENGFSEQNERHENEEAGGGRIKGGEEVRDGQGVLGWKGRDEPRVDGETFGSRELAESFPLCWWWREGERAGGEGCA